MSLDVRAVQRVKPQLQRGTMRACKSVEVPMRSILVVLYMMVRGGVCWETQEQQGFDEVEYRAGAYHVEKRKNGKKD